MPCSDGREDLDREDDRHMRRGAALLCDWLTKVEEAGGIVFVPMPIQLWWAEHKKRDAGSPWSHPPGLAGD